MTLDKIKTVAENILYLALGLFIGIFTAELITDRQMKANNNTVKCIEYITIDNDFECSLFEWRGQMYATEFAPTYEQ